MNRWTAGVCIAALAGCAGPRISVTDASPGRFEFLVQDAGPVPMQDMDEQAASHCRQYGRSYRRTKAVWTSPTLKRVAYECGPAERSPKRQPEARRTPSHATPATAAKPASNDPRPAAWAKVKAATDAWALCLRLDAERRARETTEAPQLVAEKAVGACSGLEQAVHEPLKAVGEDSSRFQADMHAQAVQEVGNAVASARTETGMAASKPPAF